MPLPNMAVSLTQTKSAARSPARARISASRWVAADLLLALDDELEVDRKLPDGLDEALDRLGVDVHLPLVVDDAATPRRPPRRLGSNGGVIHSSSGSTGCTSWWP